MYLLDADTLEQIFRANRLVTGRLDRTPPSVVWVSSITSEEMLGGTLSAINAARNQRRADVETPSRYFVRLIERLRAFRLAPYTNLAEEVYQNYGASVKRVGKMDCRLAAHAAVLNFTIVTCNTSDFEKIPGVRLEDWSRA